MIGQYLFGWYKSYRLDIGRWNKITR